VFRRCFTRLRGINRRIDTEMRERWALIVAYRPSRSDTHPHCDCPQVGNRTHRSAFGASPPHARMRRQPSGNLFHIPIVLLIE
jgi:hypothetical protein